MGGLGVSVQVVRVDVEWNELEGIEAWREDDGHVVGGADGHGGNVRSGARPDVRPPVLQNAVLDSLDQLQKKTTAARLNTGNVNYKCLMDLLGTITPLSSNKIGNSGRSKW